MAGPKFEQQMAEIQIGALLMALFENGLEEDVKNTLYLRPRLSTLSCLMQEASKKDDMI
jgi:hypothetical protein